MFLFLVGLQWTGISGTAAQLRWDPNPSEENIAFYTVHADSILGTSKFEVRDSTSLDLAVLLQNLVSTLSVTATSAAGLESERSAPIHYVPALAPPRITRQPLATNVAVGGVLRFSVEAFGAGQLSFRWNKNGVPIPGATDRELVVTNATLANSGTYTVSVSSLLGSEESQAVQAAVLAPPQIISQPQPLAIAVGSRVLMSVGADGSQLHYQWFKDGSALPNQTNLTLLIPSIATTDAGNYSVTVSNLVGQAQSATAPVSVWPRIEILQQPLSLNVLIGGRLSLSVVANGPAPLTYQWYRGSTPIPGATTAQLIISPVDLTHSGVYSVRIQSIAQNISSANAVVTVVQEPVGVDCLLTVSRTTSGQMNISASGPPNANFDLQIAADLRAPNWQLLQSVSTDALGRFTTRIPVQQSGSGFIRAARR
ncbi:MAG TPA: immunoglobulin domain-containing protein [Verrucomicrobiae bacterium]